MEEIRNDKDLLYAFNKLIRGLDAEGQHARAAGVRAARNSIFDEDGELKFHTEMTKFEAEEDE
jgi:hypothetical protein